jgi:Tol biopolymer transport system component
VRTRSRGVSRRGLLNVLATLGATGLSALATAGCVPPTVTPPLTPTAGGPAPTATPRAGPPGMTLANAAASLPGRLLFVADANVWLLERGQLRAVTTDRVSRQPSWSRDGLHIALTKLWTSGADLWTMDADGRNAQELTDFTYRQDAQQNYALQPIWSADNSRLYFLSQEGTPDTQLWQVTLADKRRQRFLAHGERFGGIDRPRLSPDGRTLAVASFQPGRGNGGQTHRSQIWTYTLPSGPWRQLTEAPGGAYDPEWAPDGRLAYVVRAPDAGRSTGRHDVWTMRADGTGQRPITTSGLNRAPSWAPDGTWLAFLSARTGTFDVWAVPMTSDAAPALGIGASTTAVSSPTAAPLAVARQVTQNGALDTTSGLAWGR